MIETGRTDQQLLDGDEMQIQTPSTRGTQSAVSAVCPRLRLADDTATHCLFPTSQHVCVAQPDQAHRLGIAVQGELCLTSAHTQCEWYRPAAQQFVSLNLDEPRASPRLIRPRVTLNRLIVMAFLVAAIGGLWLTVASLKPERHNVAAQPAQSSGAIEPAEPQPTFVLQAPPLSPEVAAAEVGPPIPTPESTPASASFASDPRPRAELEQTHVVAEGESLWALAQQYRVEIDELATRNGLSSDARLAIGDRLIIPAPAR